MTPGDNLQPNVRTDSNPSYFGLPILKSHGMHSQKCLCSAKGGICSFGCCDGNYCSVISHHHPRQAFTVSTNTRTLSGLVSGYTPWPRLAMWGPPAKLASMVSVAALTWAGLP